MARRLVLDGGHGFLCHALEQMGGPFLHLWGYPPHVQAQFDLSMMDEAQVKLLNENQGHRTSMILRITVPEGLQSRRGVVIEKLMSPRWLYLRPPEA